MVAEKERKEAQLNYRVYTNITQLQGNSDIIIMNNSWQQLEAVNQNFKYSQPATRFPSQQQT